MNASSLDLGPRPRVLFLGDGHAFLNTNGRSEIGRVSWYFGAAEPHVVQRVALAYFDLIAAKDQVKTREKALELAKQLVAEKVETRDEFAACLDLGFDYFQGYYFARPVIMSGKKLSPSQLALVELMSLITSDADNPEIERAIKRDVSS